MKVPEAFVGKMVSIQLARPVYLFGYASHFKWDGTDHVMVEPIFKEIPNPKDPNKVDKQISMTDLIMAAVVRDVWDGWVRVALFDAADEQGGNVLLKTIPEGLILSIDQLETFDADLPTVTVHKRAAQAPSRVIL